MRLLPARNSLILRGEFVHVSLDDPKVQYKAISYCWGTDPLDQQFWVSHRNCIPMTPSLHSILQVLRSEGEQHLYWIDALCIDQSNKAEQTHQIRLMRNIFATAQHVIAFIGEPSEDSDIAMQFLKRLELSLSGLNLMRGNGLLHQVDENLDMNMQTLVQMDLTRYPSVGWSALKNLLLRPWFQRSWCIQECVVAQDVILRCGAETVKWEELAYAMGLLLPTGLSYFSGVDTNGYLQLEGCLNLQATFVLKSHPGYEPVFKLQHCLMFANEFSATIPHDKIFSMLGLAGDAADPALDPGYGMSAQELYTSVTSYLFRRDRSLLLIHLAGIGYPRTLDGLPSWVPDFSHRRKSTILGSRDQYADPIASDARFERSNEMTITGIYIDEVQEAREPMPEICRSHDRVQSKQSRADIITWLDASKEWATTFGLGGAQRDLEISFWRTLLCGMPLATPFAGKGRVPEGYPDLFEAAMVLFRTTVDLPMPPDVEAAMMSVLFEESDVFVKMLMECRGRRLFRTKTGYIGLGPAGLAPGDKVFIIDGTITPFLFRKVGSESVASAIRGTLVGECYVDGIMKDEGRR